MVALMIALIATPSCRPASIVPPPGPDDPNIPTPPGDEQTVSIALLKSLYRGAPVRITQEWRISGAVVSDDRLGNFYKTLVLDDGTAGIEVRLGIEQIFKTFWIHSRVAVRCNGLWLGSYGGTLQLGAEPFGDYQTQPLPETTIAQHLFFDREVYGEVRPRTLTFATLTPGHVSTFVAFEGVRFAEAEQGLPWAETLESPDGTPPPSAEGVPSATDRHLVDAAGDTLVVRTSRHARFATWPLPAGTGRIEGVLGRFGDTYQLVVTDSEKFSAARPRN
jgi:hypothetical protein